MTCAPGCGQSDKACPLVVVLHAKGDDDAGKMRAGLFGGSGPTFKEGSYCVVFPTPVSGADFNAAQDSADYPRIIDVTNRVIEQFNIDREEVFLFGWSHGALMAYMTMCRPGASTPFVAVAAASHQIPWTRGGSPPQWECCPNSNFRLMHAHGTADQLLPMDDQQYWACALPADFVKRHGQTDNGCSGPDRRSASHLQGAEIEAYDHGCSGRGSAALYRLPGAGHEILSPALWEEAWDFFVDAGTPPVLSTRN